MSHLRWCINVETSRPGVTLHPSCSAFFGVEGRFPKNYRPVRIRIQTQPPSQLQTGMPAEGPGYELRWESM